MPSSFVFGLSSVPGTLLAGTYVLRKEYTTMAQTTHRKRSSNDSTRNERDNHNSNNDRQARGQSDNLRDSPMMAHLLDALEKGTDVGHYGRLVFAMVARH